MLSSGDETIIRRTVIEHGMRRTASDWAIGRANSHTILKIAHQHEDDKRDLQGLNQKFGVYLERVKFLEINNEKLKKQIENLRQKWGFDLEKTKEQYEPDLIGLRKRLDKVTFEKQSKELEIRKATYDVSFLQHQTDFFNGFIVLNQDQLVTLKQQFEGSQLELGALRNQVEDKKQEVERLKNEMKRQFDYMQVLRNEFNHESMARYSVEIELQTLQEQLIFLKVVNEQECKEWTTLSTMTIDGGQFYRTELTQAIVSIKKDFEILGQMQRQQLEEYYKTKTEEIHQHAVENERKKKEASRSKQDETTNTTLLNMSLNNTRDEYQKLKSENSDLANDLHQLKGELERIRSYRNRSNIDDERQLIALQTKANMLQGEITEVHENNVSLQFEISVYRRLLETNQEKTTPQYLVKISKTSFKLKKLKDFTTGIFIDTSGSTSTTLDSGGISILEAEQSIHQNITFDNIVTWNDTAQLCTKNQSVQSAGGTSPQSIFQDPSTKQAFLSSDVIVFVTDGEIDPRSVTEFARHTKNNLNKALIVAVIVNNKVAQPSHVNVSVVAPLLVGSNVLCLFYDGQTFYVLSSKGYISKFYQSPTSLADYNSLKTLDMFELFHTIDMYENVKLPDGFIPIRDDEEEIIGLHFKQFIGLTNLHEVIRMDEEEWKALIQYGKINNRLDELRKFVIRMKDAANPIDLKTIEEKVAAKYIKEQNDIKSMIASLESSQVQDNEERIATLRRQLQDISDRTRAEIRDGINLLNTNRHQTRDYWSNVDNMIYSQTIGSYSINDFTLASRRPI